LTLSAKLEHSFPTVLEKCCEQAETVSQKPLEEVVASFIGKKQPEMNVHWGFIFWLCDLEQVIYLLLSSHM
jgi:hypothetical protein